MTNLNVLLFYTVFIYTGNLMLTNYIQTKTQQVSCGTAASSNVLSNLTLSYDLNNYYSLLSHIAQDEEQRWILFIAPPGKPNATFLQQAGIHKNRIITLPQNKMADQLFVGDHSVLDCTKVPPPPPPLSPSLSLLW